MLPAECPEHKALSNSAGMLYNFSFLNLLQSELFIGTTREKHSVSQCL